MSLRSGLPWHGSDPYEYPKKIIDRYLKTSYVRTNFDRSVEYGGFLRPPVALAAMPSTVHSQPNEENDKFKVMLNVKNFNPHEVKVKVVRNNIVVHGKHDLKCDSHGFIRREFSRRYELPEGADLEKLKSSLSIDGVLIIETTKKPTEALPSNERVIPIIISSAASEQEMST